MAWVQRTTWLLVPLVLGIVVTWVFEPALNSDRSSLSRGEKSFRSSKPNSNETQIVLESFPSFGDKASKVLSIIVPAYNEQERFPIMMNDTIEFFSAKCQSDVMFSFEIVVVDDGSTDETGEIVMKYVRKYGSDVVRLLTLNKNQGKGAAIRKGMMVGRGEYLLMADADGATNIQDFDKLYTSLKNMLQEKGSQSQSEIEQLGAAFGSRAHLKEGSVAKRAFYRTVLMYGMHLCVSVLCTTEIKDTQCGFKLFTRQAALSLFPQMHLERWGFDIELVQLSQYLKVTISEVSVDWHEVEGSKLITSKIDVLTASIIMFRDMLCVRLCFLLGLWDVETLEAIILKQS